MFRPYIGPIGRKTFCGGRVALDRWQRQCCPRKGATTRFAFPEQATRWTLWGDRRRPLIKYERL